MVRRTWRASVVRVKDLDSIMDVMGRYWKDLIGE